MNAEMRGKEDLKPLIEKKKNILSKVLSWLWGLVKKLFKWLWSLVIKFYDWRKAWGKQEVKFTVTRNSVIRSFLIVGLAFFVGGVFFNNVYKIGQHVGIMKVNDPQTNEMFDLLEKGRNPEPNEIVNHPGEYLCEFTKGVSVCRIDIPGFSNFVKTSPFQSRELSAQNQNN